MNNAENLPEEKLLRLIKGGKKAAVNTPAEDMIISRKTGVVRLRFSYGHLKICAGALLAFSLFLLGRALFAPAEPVSEIRLGTGYGQRTPAPEKAGTLDQYLENMDAGAVFKVQMAAGQAGQGKEAVLPELIKDLNLLGIVSGDVPQAVIENKKDQQTYYLTKGQFIDEMRVSDIQENKVILEYKGKHAELHL
ncbi:MAG: hypothetical protein ACM3OC_04075 [Deltaproteobacteria bacterium]